MIEQQLTETFHVAIADEPLLGFDPDVIADEAKRGLRRRQALVGTAIATSTVVVVVGVTAIAFRHHADVAGAVPAATSAEPSATATRPRSTPRVPPLSEIAANPVLQTLTALGPHLLSDHMPERAFAPLRTWYGYKPSTEFDPNVPGAYGAYAFANDPQQGIQISVYHKANGLDLNGDPHAGEYSALPLIRDDTNPDGSRLRVYGEPPKGQTGAGLYVIHYRTNGVIATASTATKRDQNGYWDVFTAQAQLTAIATDPRLTM